MRKLTGYGPSLIVLVTATLVLLFGPGAVRHLTFKQTEARIVQARHRIDGSPILAELNQAFEDIATAVEPAVVHVSAEQVLRDRRGYPTSLSSGSGWIYDEEGHVVTNHHVIRDADRIEVQLSSGELRDAEIVGYDKTTDIAVLQIPPGHLHAADRAEPGAEVRQGNLVFAFGSPFDFRFSMSAGVVSGQGRSVDVLGPAGYENFIQVDAAINPGNSGGPLTDYRGRVIGMNTAIATGRNSSLEEGQFAGIGLAIPLDMIEPVVTQIIKNGGIVEKGLLGIVPARLNIAEAQEQFGFIGTGVVISEVHPNFPAATAGLQVNDIITAVNGTAISAPSQLRSLISSSLPGEMIELRVWRPDPEQRSGSEMTVHVKLDRLDPLRDTGVLPDNQDPEHVAELGIAQMRPATAKLAEEQGIRFHPGVLVLETVPGTDFAERVEPGSTIVDVMGYAISDVDEFYDLLRMYNLRQGVRIGVIAPDGRVLSVRLQVEP